ncbi:MAG: MFS transporter, partial [Anaerovibrio sp.]|nr:MFS transporter [Anaerovibrio sp.]
AELTTFYAVLMMVNGMAPILAPVLGGQILLLSSWHGIFVVLAGIGMIMALATLIFKETLLPDNRIKSFGATLRILPELLKDRYFMGHCLLQSFVFMSFFCYIGSSSFIFQGIFGVSAQEFSFIFGGLGIGMLVLGPVPAKLAGRVAESRILLTAVAVQIVSGLLLLLAFVFTGSLWIVLLFLAGCVMPISVIATVSFSLALNRQGRNAGSASALLGFFSMFLGAIMMPAAGYFGTATGVPMSVLMLLGFVLAMVCYQTMIRPDHE